MAKVLIIEPHSDDSCIGIGGYLLKYSQIHEFGFLLMCASDIEFYHTGLIPRAHRLNEYANYVDAFDGHLLLESGTFDSESRLDALPKSVLVGRVEKAIELFQPEVLITQGPSFHQDHTATYEAVFAATRPTKKLSINHILTMENPTYVHSPYPNSINRPNLYIELTEAQVDQKISLFKACFPSQVRDDENCLSPSGIKAWARYRGIEARCLYAEALSVSYSKL